MNMLQAMRKQLQRQRELIRKVFIPEDVSSCNKNAHVPGIVHAVLVAGLYPMAGRGSFLPPKIGKRVVEITASGAQSLDYKLSFWKSNDYPLVIYDEITLGDGGMHVRNCSVIGPLPLLLLATEIVVTPAEDGSEEDDRNDYDSADGAESDEDGMETDGRLGTQHVRLYILTNTKYFLLLWRPIYIYCILSIDGLRGISLPTESVESLTSMVHATEIGKPASGRRGMNQNPNSFLSLLMNNDSQQTIPSHTLQGPASAGNGSGMHGRLGPGGASSKRQRGNAVKEHAYYL